MSYHPAVQRVWERTGRPDFSPKRVTEAKFGGLNAKQKEQLAEWSAWWNRLALDTTDLDAVDVWQDELKAIGQACHALYGYAKLSPPRVVVVPSPLVMALAGGAAAWWWHCQEFDVPATYAATGAVTRAATDAATHAATYDATHAATYDATGAATLDATLDATGAATLDATYDVTGAATGAATDAATRAATRAATDAATYAATDAATDDATGDATDAATRAATGAATRAATQCASRWYDCSQGGNMWAAFECYLTGCRDVLGLSLRVHESYQAWESLAYLSGFRWLHSKFVMVCRKPVSLKTVLEGNVYLPHCNDGPSHQWADGWSLWHLRGIAVDEQIVMRPDTQTVKQINADNNEERRAIRIDRFGWPRYLKETNATLLDHRHNQVENTKEALVATRGHGRLIVTCPTGRVFALGVPSEAKTCEQAQNWLGGGKKRNVIART